MANNSPPFFYIHCPIRDSPPSTPTLPPQPRIPSQSNPSFPTPLIIQPPFIHNFQITESDELSPDNPSLDSAHEDDITNKYQDKLNDVLSPDDFSLDPDHEDDNADTDLDDVVSNDYWTYQTPTPIPYEVPDLDDRGIGVIFSNKKFENDRQYLTKMFEMMRLTVYQHTDLSSDVILTTLKKLAQDQIKTSHYVLFVAFIMVGDATDTLYGNGGGSFSLRQDILPLFKSNKCNALNGKPKLFLIQAYPREILRDAMVKEEVISRESDLLISYASVQQYKAHQTHEDGPWFLEHLFETYERYCEELNFMNILTLTNQSVLLRYNSNENAQPSHIESTLRKFLLLKPKAQADVIHQESESSLLRLPQDTYKKDMLVKEPVNRDEIIHPRVKPKQYNLCLQECRGETSKFNGLGMIFVSETFHQKVERDVAQSDLQRLQSLFQQMQLRIKTINNPTRYDYLDGMKRKILDNVELSSVFIVISSYRGDGNTILCSDNRSVSGEEIIQILQMKELDDKPKVLIIEASVRCTTIQSIDNAISIQYNRAKLRDILLAYSCIPDYIPPNTVDTSEGSWFITSVLEAYEKFKGGNEDLFRILTSANDFKPSQSCTIVIQSTLNKLLMI